MVRKTIPFLGVLLFWGQAQLGCALEVPREVLLELNRPIEIQADATSAHTGLPDVDALLGQYQGCSTHYALRFRPDRHPQLKKFLLIRLPNDGQKPEFLKQILALSSVRWAQSNHLLQTHFTPDDPYFSDQWGLQRTGAQAAWDVSRGDTAIPIAIIDTGCEMDHPDLIPSFWTNPGEIPNNNIDDDNNGFVDDIHGWDFVDAPSFPSSGDYLVRDNDPSDENGHGTAVAGICGAALDNGIGVAGLAPDCPLMILRAGNMNGYLQEDDIASALLYALDNGARVVNMSFGDTEASPMLADVIGYAAQGGLMMVGAAGNYGNSGNVYPAAFGSVLCVGASNENNARANFSSYGAALDLLAPGTDITSTLMNHEYGPFQGGNGTSFATAFASAAAGLVFSQHPDWNASIVASALKSSCDDLPPAGWDEQSGQGILRTDRAVQIQEALVAQITSPTMSQGISQAETLQVQGTAAGVYIEGFTLLAGMGENSTEWDTIQSSKGLQVIDDVLGYWILGEPTDTAYTIRLDVRDIFGNFVDDRVVVYFDPSPPQISDILLVPILDADRPSYLLTFHTDDMTTGKVWLRALHGPLLRWISLALNYQSTDHTVLIGQNLTPGDWEYYIWVTNSAGLVDSTAILDTLTVQTSSVATDNFVEQPTPGIPPGYLYEEATDLDGDGFLEIWEDTLDASGSQSDLRVWEAGASWTFNDLGLGFGKQIPKSIGDSDADGKQELLTLYAGASKIFEATTGGAFPQSDNIAWSDSGNVWGTKLLDLDPGDGHGELLLSTDSLIAGQPRGIYQLWARYPTGQSPTLIQSLVCPFETPSNFLPPYCQAGDFDNDGRTELLFGDYAGHLYIYERPSAGAEFQVSWTDSVPLLDPGEFLTSGDYDGDGNLEFAALAHTQTELAGEHLADTRYWAMYAFKSTANNEYSPLDTLYFFGAQNLSAFPSGISSGDVYGGSGDEILLCLYPNFYVIGWDSVGERFGVLWYYPECQSNKAVVGDFNRNGVKDILFNSGLATRIFEAVGPWSNYPPPPLHFEATPAPDRVNLSWDLVSGADRYNLYRGASATSLEFLAEAQDTVDAYTDFDVVLDSTYYYAISTVDLTSPTAEGPTTVPLAATPNTPPYIVGDTAHFVSPDFVTVDFSEPMSLSILDPNNYWVAENNFQPSSIVSDAGGTRAVLTFGPAFADTTYRLVITEVYDLQGSPLSTINDTVYFDVVAAIHILPYLVSAIAANGGTTVVLHFSQLMNHDDLTLKSNYAITIDPISNLPSATAINILTAQVDSTIASTSVSLQLDPNTRLGAFGKIYRVAARNLVSEGGLSIDTTHNQATINFSQTNLDNVFAYPNPYTTGTLIDGQACVVFANLTPNAEIRILTLSGVLIKEIKNSNNISGGARWYLENERGEPVGSGVYLYYVSGDGDTKWGKLAVVR